MRGSRIEARQRNGLLRFTLASLVVMGHLKACPPETALDVKTLVGFTAVQDALVATNLFGDVVEGLDDSKAKFLALLVLCNGDIFNMPNGTEIVNAFGAMSAVHSEIDEGLRDTYNLRSTIRAPVPTTGRSVLVVSSMMMM